jgi:hypothetical protein
MKRLASVIAIAALSLPFATSVSADELSYALAYEAEIEANYITFTTSKDLDIPLFRALFTELKRQLIVDRDGTFDMIGEMKTKMCAGYDPDKYREANWATYQSSKKRPSDKLKNQARQLQIGKLHKLPCK